jgi:osmotically inducible protein OsmC
MITRTGSARYEGLGKDGKGWVSTGSGVLKEQRYGFGTRFEDEPGTNPEELIAAAHAGCFTMALAFALAKEGLSEGRLETTARVKLEKDGDGFTVTRSDLSLTAAVPGIEEARFRTQVGAWSLPSPGRDIPCRRRHRAAGRRPAG